MSSPTTRQNRAQRKKDADQARWARRPSVALDVQGQHHARHGGPNIGNAKDATGHISLRSAIQAANARGGSSTIILASGTFALTILGANEDNGATGDRDIKSNLTIKGKSSAKTIIDGNDNDRVSQVLSGEVSISGV